MKKPNEGSTGPSLSGPRKRFSQLRWVRSLAGVTPLMMLGYALVHITGATSQRVATATMQPLVINGTVSTAQAYAMASLCATGVLGLVLQLGWARRVDKVSVSALFHSPDKSGLREGLYLIRYVLCLAGRNVPGIGYSARIKALYRTCDKGGLHEALCLVGFPLCLAGTNFAGIAYSARMPFGAGNAITTWGPSMLSFSLTLYGVTNGKEVSGQKLTKRDLVLPITLLIVSVGGALLMLPWGEHFNLAGVLFALGGAVCSAGIAYSAKTLTDAGLGVKTQAAGILLGLLLSGWTLFGIKHWTGALWLDGAIAGCFSVMGAVLYNWAQARHRLQKEVSTALAANGPALSSIVGHEQLGQPIRPLAAAGIAALLGGGLFKALYLAHKEGRQRGE